MYLSARESNQGVPSRFRKLDRKSHELYLIDRKLVSQRSKAETQEHATFGQYVLNNTKALTKVTKDHQKKPKSLITTIIFNRLTVTINDVRSFNNRVHS